MKIGFDVSQTAKNKSGCGFFADQLIRALAACNVGHEYLLYPTFYSYRHPAFKNVTQPESPHCSLHFRGMTFEDQIRGWETPMADRTQWLGNPDIVHSNNFSCIKDHGARIVYTIYDVTPLVHPEYTTEENRVVCFTGLFNASIYADHCIAISESTKASFLDFFPHYPRERVTVAHLGVRPSLITSEDAAGVGAVLKRLRLCAEDFWLSVGTIEPRKNYDLLIEAYRKSGDRRPLVIAGGRGWMESEIYAFARERGLGDRVRFVGYVSDEELRTLYRSCLGFIYPSHYEGFGLPVLEAMACGAAVICSGTSSLPEVGGDSVLYCDHRSPQDLVAKMTALADDACLRRQLKDRARARAELFTWHKTAEVTLSVYERAATEEPWFTKKA